MKLTLTLTDERGTHRYANMRPVLEEYERANVEGSGKPRFIAQVLRGLADEIDPPYPSPLDSMAAAMGVDQ